MLETIQKEDMYGEYINLKPSFPPCHGISNIQFPAYVYVMARINIKAKTLELAAACENAMEIAGHYRERCAASKNITNLFIRTAR